MFRHGGGRKTAPLIRILGSKIKTVSLLFGEPYMIQLIPLVPARPLTHTCRETHTRVHTLIPHRAQTDLCLCNSVTIIWQPVKNIKSCCPQQRVVFTTAAAEMSSVKLFFPLNRCHVWLWFLSMLLPLPFCYFLWLWYECFAFCALFFPFCVSYTREWNWGLYRVQHLKGKSKCGLLAIGSSTRIK